MTGCLRLLAIGTAVCALGASATAQQANPVVGTWTLASADSVRGDAKTPLFGDKPAGMLVFDASGRYSLQICTGTPSKFAGNDRTKGTAEENQAAAARCNPHWGRYSVSGDTIQFKIERAVFGNWEGTEQARKFTIKGDELSYSVPNPSQAGTSPVIVWRRAQ